MKILFCIIFNNVELDTNHRRAVGDTLTLVFGDEFEEGTRRILKNDLYNALYKIVLADRGTVQPSNSFVGPFYHNVKPLLNVELEKLTVLQLKGLFAVIFCTIL